MLFYTLTQRRLITNFGKFSSTDPYYILGASKDEDLKTIKKKYYELAKKYHPDSTEGLSEAVKAANEEKFKRISSAYEVLGNKEHKS